VAPAPPWRSGDVERRSDHFGPLLNSLPAGMVFGVPPPELGPLPNSLAAGTAVFGRPPGVLGPLLNSLPAGIFTPLAEASAAGGVAAGDIDMDPDVPWGDIEQPAARPPARQTTVAILVA